MSTEERMDLFNDEWPSTSTAEKAKLLKAIKKASKAGLFEYVPQRTELVTQK